MSKKHKKSGGKNRRSLHSGLDHHKRVGKTLLPPLASLTNHFSSWRDDHAPEMLWAHLLAASLGRAVYLNCFRAVAGWCQKNKQLLRELNPPQPHDSEGGNSPCEIDLTGLSLLPLDKFKEFFALIVKHPLGYGSLRPLLLIKALPGLGRWRDAIGVDATDADWETLSRAVIETFDHQSEISTDVRWLKLLQTILVDRMFFQESMQERVQEYFDYPNRGDMRGVRPSIRASEMMLRRNPPSKWVGDYWKQLREETGCLDSSDSSEYSEIAPPPALLKDTILNARAALSERFDARKSSIRTDAKLDAAFGFCFYSLSLLEEVAAPPISQLILGRLGLRSLVEVVITFAYLLTCDEDRLWHTYRRFGSGQAKLAFLKLEEATGDAPSFVEKDTLEQIASEDLWQEYLEIDLGHWAKMNLRELAEKSGTKAVYDAYYSWTSTFSHGHWCAVRDSNFVTCHNPLHRLHRIPRPLHRLMPTVVMDAVELTNRTLELLEKAYPDMEKMARIERSASKSAA